MARWTAAKRNASGGHSSARRQSRSARERSDELERAVRTYQIALRLLLHDTKEPLHRIRRFLEMRTEGPSNLAEAELDVRPILQDLERIERVLSAVDELDRAPGPAGDVDTVETDLPAFVRGVVEDLDQATHEINVDIEDGRYSLDRPLVERALANLVSNALTHTPIGSTVWVRARGGSGQLVFSVEDDGPGIAPADRERVFEPFERGGAPDSTPGMGLGLALVRGIAEVLGGDVTVEDRDGGGASVRLVVPVPGPT